MAMRVIRLEKDETPELFTMGRDFAYRGVEFTKINGGLYLTTKQVCEVLELPKNVISQHVVNIIEEDEIVRNSRDECNTGELDGSCGTNPCPPGDLLDDPDYFTVYALPVKYVRDDKNASAGGAGTQMTQFYNAKLVLEIATRMKNSARKSVIIRWIVNTMNEFIRDGSVVDLDLIAKDQDAMDILEDKVTQGYLSEARLNMIDVNKRLASLLKLCTDTTDADGKLIPKISRYCMRCLHNTGHVVVHGMTVAELLYTRIDGTHEYCGMRNFYGKRAPWASELKVGCGYLTDPELIERSYRMGIAIDLIRNYVRTYGKIPHDQMLRMFTMWCTGKVGISDVHQWVEYPPTAIFGLASNKSRASSVTMRWRVTDEIRYYLSRRKKRSEMCQLELTRDNYAESTLVDACINSGLYDKVDPTELAKRVVVDTARIRMRTEFKHGDLLWLIMTLVDLKWYEFMIELYLRGAQLLAKGKTSEYDDMIIRASEVLNLTPADIASTLYKMLETPTELELHPDSELEISRVGNVVYAVAREKAEEVTA